MRHIENSTLKDSLRLNNLQPWNNKYTKSFIKTSVNLKQKPIKVPGKDKLHKNLSKNFEECYT